jgi:hypothetical protein
MKNRCVTKLAVVVGLVLMAAAARGVELSATLMRDVVYESEPDSVVRPAAAALGVGFRFGPIGMVQLRVGGSLYWNQSVDVGFDDAADVRESFQSVWVQAIPGVRVPLFYEPLSAYGGIGLGGRSSAERRVDRDNGDEVDYHDRSVWAFDQTFLLGLAFSLSRRFDINLEVQRPGLTADYRLTRSYRAYEGWGDPIEGEREDLVGVGWRAPAATGMGVGLRLKL